MGNQIFPTDFMTIVSVIIAAELVILYAIKHKEWTPIFLTHKKRTDLKNLCAFVRFFLLELQEKDCIGGGGVV